MSEYLGQHFLKNTAAVKAIIAALNLTKGDVVIEIGPGKGALTLPLLAACEQLGCQLTVLERDSELAQTLPQHPLLKVVEGDALVELPKVVASLAKNTRYKLVGNIPYYITGSLLRTTSELINKPAITILMIQLEVARRITAPAGSMNLLAAAVQYWAQPKILLTLKQQDFDPPPKVKSAVISLLPTPRETAGSKEYYDFLHIAFKQPRKLLSNNLREGGVDAQTASKLLMEQQLDPKTRPQNLSITQLIELSKQWATLRGNKRE